MAGGSDRPGTGLPAWLTAANDAERAEQAEQAERAARRALQRPPRRVHCWVHSSDGDWPGLVLDWRRGEQGWWAHVVWTRLGGDLLTAWVQASTIEPAVAAPSA